MQANILVFDHDPSGLQRIPDVEILAQIGCRSAKTIAQLLVRAILCKGDAVHRTDVDAGVAFDAERTGEDGLDIAIEAPLAFEKGQFVVVAELDLGLDVVEGDREVAQRHPVAQIVRDVVVVAPLVDAHLLAGQRDARRRPFADILGVAQFVDRYRRIMAVRDSPDDVFWAECRIAAEEHIRQARLHGFRVDLGHVPAVEFDTDIAFDPRKRVFLADRDEDIVAGDVGMGLAGRHEVAPAFLVVFRLDLLEQDAGELAVLMGELDGHEKIEDRDALVRRVLFLPGRGLHLLEARAYDDGNLLAAEAARGAAAIHRRVAAAEHDDAAADLVDMTKRDGGQPVDADMDMGARLLAPGKLDLAAARRAGADKDRVPALVQQRAHAVDVMTEAGLDPHVEDQVDLFVGDGFGQAKARDLAAHHAAALAVAGEHDAVIAQGHQVARYGQRGRAGADQGNALAVLFLGDRRKIAADVALVVGGDALQPADRDGLLLDPTAAAGRLAGPVAGPAENSRKDVRFPIDRPGIAKAPGGDQADILRHRRMRRASPLAIDDLMEIVGIADVSRLQYAFSRQSAEIRPNSLATRPARHARPPGPAVITPDAAAPYTRTRGGRH